MEEEEEEEEAKMGKIHLPPTLRKPIMIMIIMRQPTGARIHCSKGARFH